MLAAARHTWVAVLVGAGTFVVTIGAFTDFLMEKFGTWQTAALALGVTALIVILARPLEVLTQFVRSLKQPELSVAELSGQVPRHRGLIVLSSIGPGIGSAESAIRYHWRGFNNEHHDAMLEQCWIITGGTGSERSAAGLVNKLVQEARQVRIQLPKTSDSVEILRQLRERRARR
jgi:hypothetical protein